MAVPIRAAETEVWEDFSEGWTLDKLEAFFFSWGVCCCFWGCCSILLRGGNGGGLAIQRLIPRIKNGFCLQLCWLKLGIFGAKGRLLLKMLGYPQVAGAWNILQCKVQNADAPLHWTPLCAHTQLYGYTHPLLSISPPTMVGEVALSSWNNHWHQIRVSHSFKHTGTASSCSWLSCLPFNNLKHPEHFYLTRVTSPRLLPFSENMPIIHVPSS